ncbi:hypothetical protein B0H14DRAFT_3866323 [Mycena olivaceomarginata]|nr:hypothetical protein B0H14DRAFT_3866323 [Mycena olivaceomarginata]
MDNVDFKGPMSSVRTRDQLSGDDWQNVLNIVHFFNEPERAGVSPAEAAQLWEHHMVPLRKEHGKKLRVGAHPPDYLGLHYYDPNGDDAAKFIEEMHEAHPKMPVILANWMDGQEWVFEYSFFGCMTHVADGFVSPEAQLMKPDGHFTELMDKLMHEVPVKA